MSWKARNTVAPIRTFRLPDSHEGPYAIGRRHSSWFLCYVYPEDDDHRIANCLNWIGGPNTSPRNSPEGNPRFVLNNGPQVIRNTNLLEDLLSMRDGNGRPPIKLTELKVGNLPVVEVLVPPDELVYSCSYCECLKWETRGRPRFVMCETCRARRYCTAKCLHADDKINLHMSDCTLLKLGLEGIVAERRGWHVNDWGEKREREGKDPNPRTRFFGAYDKDPNYWNH